MCNDILFWFLTCSSMQCCTLSHPGAGGEGARALRGRRAAADGRLAETRGTSEDNTRILMRNDRLFCLLRDDEVGLPLREPPWWARGASSHKTNSRSGSALLRGPFPLHLRRPPTLPLPPHPPGPPASRRPGAHRTEDSRKRSEAEKTALERK